MKHALERHQSQVKSVWLWPGKASTQGLPLVLLHITISVAKTILETNFMLEMCVLTL